MNENSAKWYIEIWYRDILKISIFLPAIRYDISISNRYFRYIDTALMYNVTFKKLSLSLSLSLSILSAISRWTWVIRYQNVSILNFVGAKDDGSGGNNWSYKTCKAPVKSSPPTNQHPVFYRPDALPVAQPTVSKHWRKKFKKTMTLKILKHSLLYCGMS